MSHRLLWKVNAGQLRILVLVLVLAVAFFFRFYQIGQVPPGLNPDEATHALDALEVLNGQITLYSPDEGSTGALWRYLLAINFALFGSSILTLRVFASAVGIVSVGMAFLVVRELSLAPYRGEEHQIPPFLFHTPYSLLPVMATLLLAVSHWHVDLSRVGFSAVLMLLIQDATFFCLWRALNTGRQHWFVLFGLSLGVLAYNYLPGKLVPIVLLLFLSLQWLIVRRDALLVKYWRPLLMAAGLTLAVALPLVLFALFNYQTLMARAAVPTAGNLSPMLPWHGLVANLAVFGLWPALWVSGSWGAFFLGPLLTVCFAIGVGLSLVLAIRRRPAYLFLVIWWLVMLLPGVLASEGAIPNVRRAIGAATPTFALVALGLASLVGGLVWLAGRLIRLTGPSMLQPALTLILGLLLVAQTGAGTYRRYFVLWGPSEEAKLDFHVYDLELADLMARQSGAETVYLLPLDSAAGIVNPLLDSITFVYRGQASYDFLPDDEQTMLARLSKLATGKQTVRLLRWKVTKHTGADSKGVARYYLEKWGHWVNTESHPYFDIETYQLDGMPGAFTPAVLTPTDVGFEGQMTLAGYAFGAEGDSPWAELAWRKTGGLSADYQVTLWLEDQAGHAVGRVDKPLLNNLRHQGTSQWSAGAEEHDYYLLRVDPATPPGTYRLKAVLYTSGSDGRRLAPSLPGVGADLAVVLGEVAVCPPLTPPDVAVLPILHRLDLDVGGDLRLLGFDPGFTGSLRPGDRATLSLWWQATRPMSQNLAVAIGMGHGEQAWSLSKSQPLGGTNYPTRDWPAGAVVRTFVDLRLPAGVEAGEYNLGLRLLDAQSGTALSDWLLGQVEVVGRAHSFEAPPMAHPLKADFGGQVTLLGYDLDLTQVASGGPVQLTLCWQAQREMDTAYKVFVHLLDEAGQIVAQVDREPQAGAAPTTGWRAGEVLVDPVEIPVQGLERVQRIALGLYDPASGMRLTVKESGGDAVILHIGETQ